MLGEDEHLIQEKFHNNISNSDWEIWNKGYYQNGQYEQRKQMRTTEQAKTNLNTAYKTTRYL